MNKTVCHVLLAVCVLLPFVAHARHTPSHEPEEEPVARTYGIKGAFRIVGCTPPQSALTIAATRTGSSTSIVPTIVSTAKDDREITMAYFGFTQLLPGGYRVTASISDPSCSPGRWLLGPNSEATISSRSNPWPTVTFLYVTRENETPLDMASLLSVLNSLLLGADPSVQLNNHGPEHDGSRLLKNGSLFQYTELWEHPATTKRIRFSIPEVRRPVPLEGELAGALGVFKYYVNNVDDLPPGPGEQPIEWDSEQHKIHLTWKLDGSGTEIKGYYRSTLTGLSDSAAPDVDLTAPLSVRATLVPSHGLWDGRVTFPVESTDFQVNEIQAGGVCNLGFDACDALSSYKVKINNAVKDALASNLSQQSVNEFLGDSMEDIVNGGLLPPCSAQPCGAFVTGMKKEGGQLIVNWVATPFEWPSSQPTTPTPTRQCTTNQVCCEPLPDGSCLVCIPITAHCP